MSSLIQSLEEEMLKTGVTVQLSELKVQLHKVQEVHSTSGEPVEINLTGDLFDPKDSAPPLP